MRRWRELDLAESTREVESLREDSLRIFLEVCIAGYVCWLLVTNFITSSDYVLRSWITLPPTIVCLVGTLLLVRRNFQLGLGFFLLFSHVAITTATWTLQAAIVLMLYPLVALVAAVHVHPTAGLAVSATSLGLLVVLRVTGAFAFVSDDRLLEVTVVSVLTVVGVWTLGRSLTTAVGWSLESYAQASRNAKAAQEHRGRLVRTLKQLDTAYYQLQQANAALELAWKTAEAAERSKTELVANLSHELRTPLNLIVGFSEMILDSPDIYGEPLPPRYRIDLNAINRSAQHLLEMTNDVIDLARIGLDRLALAREPVDLGQVIDEAVNIIREYVCVKGLSMRVESPSDLPILNVDRLRIRQVLLNLLTNAARFTEQGSITVRAAIEDGGVLVEVTDTGRGIAPGDLDKVFEEFAHGRDEDRRIPRRLGGVGLGLPISKRFVELHGGQMGVASSVGVGTTFWFRLPIASRDGAVTAEIWQPVRQVDGARGVEPVAVAAVGDARVGQFLRRHLRGWRVVAAANLQQAITAAEDLHAVAILTDGDAAVEADAFRGSVPIVRLPMPHGRKTATTLGVRSYLVKPVTRSELTTALETISHPVRNVLVVDDDPRFVQLITRMLRSLPGGNDLQLRCTQSGQDALATMATDKPDLVILDLVMTDLSGKEVVEAMRADQRLADVPVILISGHEHLEDEPVLRGPIALEMPAGLHLAGLLDVSEALLNSLRLIPNAHSHARP